MFLENIKTYVGFDEASSAALREAHPVVAPHFGPIIDDFYATIEAHPGARAAITGGAAQIQRLKGSLLRWIDQVFLGPHDEAYFERRARIGHIHVQIDLPQVYMLTAMDRIRVQSLGALRAASAFPVATAERMITALHQILDMELAIMLETYREDLLAKNRTAERLATIGQFAAGIGRRSGTPPSRMLTPCSAGGAAPWSSSASSTSGRSRTPRSPTTCPSGGCPTSSARRS